MSRILLSLIFGIAGLLITRNSYGQGDPSGSVREKLQKEYNRIKTPEISFEKYFEINEHIYSPFIQSQSSSVAPPPIGVYCAKIRPYCTNSDFEAGLMQTEYTGAFGTWSGSLYPNPFTVPAGFSSSPLVTNSAAHQTVVNKSAGVDPIALIPVVPSNGGNQSLRLGNAVNGNGVDIIAKTITVDANESILGFYYAMVLQDPGHERDEQPAFIVRAYDCATGAELTNIVNLGNGSNIAVADANNPFFQTRTYAGERLVYRDWSRVQIDLSAHVGKNVIIVFTVKDCDLSGHFGYAYIDNLFSTNCVPPGDPTSAAGSTELARFDSCGTGSICAKYRLPVLTAGNGTTTTGSAIISLNIYQNNALVRTIASPNLTGYPADSTYCFSVNPATLGINAALGGFDFTLTTAYTLSGFSLSPTIIGNPGTGRKAGTNNDYLVICPIVDGDVYYSKPLGNLHDVSTWGKNPDGSGMNPPDFTAGKTFQLANRGASYMLTSNWTVGGKLNIPTASQLQINGLTLSIADLLGSGTLSGSTTSNLIVTTPSTGGTGLSFTAGSNALSNLTIGSTTTTSVTTALNLYGVLTAQNGTFNTGNLITLKSTAAGTARVAPVAGAISGTVTVERYFPARRAWRIVSAPVGGAQTVNAAWQEGATTSSANSNPNPGYGTHITEGAASDGLDHNPLIAMPSIKRYNSATDAWNPLANTTMPAVNADAYMLFVRGDRSIELGLNTVAPNNTTLRATGPLKIGNQTFPVSATGFTAIPNPFASPINFATLTRNNVQNNFYVWDPKMGGAEGVGGYVLLSFNGTSYDVIPNTAISAESQFIQSGQGFLVRSTGTAGSIVVKESDKSNTAETDVFRVVPGAPQNTSPFDVKFSTSTPGLRISLQSIGDQNNVSVKDEVLIANGRYSNEIDNMDAEKIPNVDENISIIRDGHSLMAERRGSFQKDDIIPLKIWNTLPGKTYQLEVNPTDVSGDISMALLLDKYLKTSTPLDLRKSSTVFFHVTADAASANAERFSIVFKELSIEFNTVKAGIATYPNPMSGKSIQLMFTDQPKGMYKVNIVSSLGQTMFTSRINHPGGTAVQKIQLVTKPSAGIYFVDVTKEGMKNTLKLIVK